MEKNIRKILEICSLINIDRMFVDFTQTSFIEFDAIMIHEPKIME